jgi:hypothetical protein
VCVTYLDSATVFDFWTLQSRFMAWVSLFSCLSSWASIRFAEIDHYQMVVSFVAVCAAMGVCYGNASALANLQQSE